MADHLLFAIRYSLFAVYYSLLTNRSLQSLTRFLDQAQIRILLHVEARFDEPHLCGGVDIALKRRQVRQHARIAIIILLRKQPAEAPRSNFEEIGGDPRTLSMVRGVEMPAFDP